MPKKCFIVFWGIGFTVLFINIYLNTMPDYGIRSQWKKLLLNTMLSADVPRISVVDAFNKKGNVLFLDTRAKEEYEVSHIEGAVYTGEMEVSPDALENVPKDQPIITYCSIGKRSDVIGKKLIDAGYTQVQNLYGGIFEWINKGYSVVDQQNHPTAKVHAYNKMWGKWLNKGTKVY